MSHPQLKLFEPGTTLADCSLEQRLAAVCSMLHAEPMTPAEREQHLLLALAPETGGAES